MTTVRATRIALVQMAMTPDVKENLHTALAAMESAAANGAQVVCFPEVQLSPFFPQFPGRDVSRYAMPIDHPAVVQLREKCAELGVVGCPNVYLQEGDRRFDASPVIDADGRIVGISKMVHVVQAPCFYEQDYYTPSDTGFLVHETAAGRIGVVVCFDRHIPESIRTCVLKGAQLIVIPTANTREEPLEMFEWELRVPAMQNGVFIAMCNRVGVEKRMDFCGQSIVVGPDGEVIVQAGDGESILYADLDLGRIEESRRARPYLALRRPEHYA